MIINRVKQGFLYLFGNYKGVYDEEVREILTKNEFEIFCKMSEYDKIHSFKLYKLVKYDNLLSGDILYKKLALLHDCGKDNMGLYERIKRVFLGEKNASHTQKSYEKLININKEVAILAKNHHKGPMDKKMERFRYLDEIV